MGCSSVLRSWRRWIRFAVVVIYIILLVIAVPLCIWELERQGAPDHVQAWFVGGLFVLMALPISLWGILQHIINYTTPHLQRHIIRILWMVPVYALNAWFALRFPAAAIYLDTLRECYEAYVIYNFMAYLLSFLHHEYPELDIQIECKPPVKHIFPLCLLPPCNFSQKFIKRCKHGVLQYTVVRPAMTVIALISEMFDKYGEGDFNFTTAWSYIVIINNLSQILAMYCLVLFYKAFKEELRPLKPVPKFVCVKAVVFLSFWQALLIAALTKMGAIPSNGSWIFYKDIKQVATGLQDFVICIEMFLAAIAHYISFSHKSFVNVEAEQQGCCTSFLSMWNVKDVTDDVIEHARYIGQGMKKTLSRGKKVADEGGSERTPLLSNRDNQTSGQGVLVHMSVQNSQIEELPSPDDDVADVPSDVPSPNDDIINEHHFIVNKSSSSNLTCADFTSNSTSQHEDAHSQSMSGNYKDASEENGIDGKGNIMETTKNKHSIFVVAEISLDNKHMTDDMLADLVEHLEDPDQIPASSHSINFVLDKDLQNDSVTSKEDISKSSDQLDIANNAHRQGTENEQSSSNKLHEDNVSK